MTEAETIDRSGGPATVDSLAEDLVALGLARGSVLVVHSSLSSIGWACGGPVAVVLALEQVLGPEGTLVMPTHTSDLSDPAHWENPPVPAEWWEVIRETMPAYDPDLTPSRAMGAIPECFRTQRGTLRSDHPQWSFAARGPSAERIVEGHSLSVGLSEDSPLGRVYELDGLVLLLGVGHERNTSMHLAEYRTGRTKLHRTGAPVAVDGERRWIEFEHLDLDSSDFQAIGADFERETGIGRRGRVGRADAFLGRQQPLVDYAADWMLRNRPVPADG